MKLQLALDALPLEEALELTRTVAEHVDIIEIGTPFIVEAGLAAVRAFRAAFPEKEILADVKIMDGARLEAGAAFEAGADYVTVLALADASTIEECVQIADACGKQIVADMICVEDIPAAVKTLQKLGVHGIAVHTGVDQQKRGRTPLQDLRTMKAHAAGTQISVAGGIDLETLPDYLAEQPQVLIVGSGICSADDPESAARSFAERIRSFV